MSSPFAAPFLYSSMMQAVRRAMSASTSTDDLARRAGAGTRAEDRAAQLGLADAGDTAERGSRLRADERPAARLTPQRTAGARDARDRECAAPPTGPAGWRSRYFNRVGARIRLSAELLQPADSLLPLIAR